jgi:hypothetical protein
MLLCGPLLTQWLSVGLYFRSHFLKSTRLYLLLFDIRQLRQPINMTTGMRAVFNSCGRKYQQTNSKADSIAVNKKYFLAKGLSFLMKKAAKRWVGKAQHKL